MEISFNEESWTEFLEKWSSYKGSLIDYCKENNITKSQFYYYKKKFKKKAGPIFHAIEVKQESTILENINNVSKGDGSIKIELGKAIIHIPSQNSALLSSVIKEIINLC